jgi:chromosome segregation ATPase
MKKDHLEILLEDIRGKFNLVLGGPDTLRKEIQDTRGELCEKINLVDFKVETLNQKIDGVESRLSNEIRATNQKIDSVEARLSEKIDAVAADLSAHRADTESHRAGYQVSETRDG